MVAVRQVLLALVLLAPTAVATPFEFGAKDILPEPIRTLEPVEQHDSREVARSVADIRVPAAPPLPQRRPSSEGASPSPAADAEVAPFLNSVEVVEDHGRAQNAARAAPAPALERDATGGVIGPAPAPPAAAGGSDATVAAVAPPSAAGALASSPAALAAAAGLAIALLLAPLYSRLTSARALEHPARAAVHAHLAENPGRTMQEIADALGMPLDTVRHHVRRLERLGLVGHASSGRRRRYHLPGSRVDPAREDALAVPVARTLAELVRAEPDVTLADLARRAGASKSLCHHHLKKLAAAGAVVAVGEGRERRYRPAA